MSGCQVTLGYVRLCQVITVKNMLGHVKSGYIRWGHVGSGYIMVYHVSSGFVW